MLDKIKDYKIQKVIGKGGMGEVYLAIHPTLKREIILKRLKTKGSDSSKRFLQEAKIMMDFRHENIVQFYDHFKDNGSTYIAMEYVKGKALNQIIQENGAVPLPLALFILYETALGLYHAHIKKIIHRDIKPHNILLSSSGNVKITDFGIAMSSDETYGDVTQDNEIIGTPAYMAPEQFSKRGEITYKADIYSLGVVFYEMITGVRPYKNEFNAEHVANVTRGNYLPINKYVKSVPSIINKVLHKTFNPKINKRYKTLLPLIKLLKKYFKKINVYEIADAVKKLVMADKKLSQCSFLKTYSNYLKRRFFYKIAALSIFSISILTFLFIYTNRYYEWITPSLYGKIILEFSMKDIDSGSSYLRIDREEYKILNSYSLKINKDYFKKKKYKSKKPFEIIKNANFKKSFYLLKGQRNISIISGSYKQTKRVIVTPRILQRDNEKNGQYVYIDNVGFWKHEAEIFFRFWDSINDKLLFSFNHYNDKLLKNYETEDENLKIKPDYSAKYINLREYMPLIKKRNENPFDSGKGYAFLVKDFELNNIKYFDKYFTVNIGVDERTVVFHESLIPKPAIIKITSSIKNLPIIINDNNKGMMFFDKNYEYKSYNSRSFLSKKIYYYTVSVPPQYIKLQIGSGKAVNKYLTSDEILEISVVKKDGKYIY